MIKKVEGDFLFFFLGQTNCFPRFHFFYLLTFRLFNLSSISSKNSFSLSNLCFIIRNPSFVICIESQLQKAITYSKILNFKRTLLLRGFSNQGWKKRENFKYSLLVFLFHLFLLPNLSKRSTSSEKTLSWHAETISTSFAFDTLNLPKGTSAKSSSWWWLIEEKLMGKALNLFPKAKNRLYYIIYSHFPFFIFQNSKIVDVNTLFSLLFYFFIILFTIAVVSMILFYFRKLCEQVRSKNKKNNKRRVFKINNRRWWFFQNLIGLKDLIPLYNFLSYSPFAKFSKSNESSSYFAKI